MGGASSPGTIANAIALLRSKAISPQALVEDSLARIAAYDSYLGSFLYCDADGARLSAANCRIEERPLAGIPVAFKDIFDVAGMPTTCNSIFRPPARPEEDAESVGQLRLQGVITLGKLAAWECGIGGTSFSLPWPPARNPWDLTRDPGGSSTGSGVAVAAGFCLGSLGSDTGGSIREPASWCGIAGLKPTFGLLPTKGVLAASYSLDHIGPMARTSEDCAILMDAFAEQHGRYSHGIADGITGLRIGVVDLDAEPALDLEADVASTQSHVETVLAGGVHLKRVELPPLATFSSVCTLISALEGLTIHREQFDLTPEKYDRLTLERLRAGQLVPPGAYHAAKAVQKKLHAAVSEAMSGCDLLLMPTTRTTAPLLGDFDSHGGHPSLCRPWNVTGLPALSVRAGFDRRGLPIGLQIIGRAYSEPLVLRAGHAIERIYEDRECWPDLATLRSTPPAKFSDEQTDGSLNNLGSVIARSIEIVNSAAL